MNPVIEAADPKPIAVFEGLTFPCISVSRDGQRAAIGGSTDGTARLRVYDAKHWKVINEFLPKGTSVKAVTFSDDGRRVVAGVGNEVIVWQLSDAKELSRLAHHSDSVFAVTTSGNGRHIISAGADGRVVVWNAQSLALERTLARHSGWVRELDFDSKRGELAAVGDNGLLRVWKGLQPDDPVSEFAGENADSLFSVRYSHKGDHIAAATDSGKTLIIGLADGANTMRTYSAPSGVGGITWLGDERLLAVGLKKAVGLMDTATGKVTTVLRDLDSRVYCMEYDHVHNRLLVGTWGGEIRVWNCDDILDGR